MPNRRQVLSGLASLGAFPINRAYASPPVTKYNTDVLMLDFEKTVVDLSNVDGGRLVVFDIGSLKCTPCVQMAVDIDDLIEQAGGNKVIGWVRTDIWVSKEIGVPFTDKWGVNKIPHVGAYYRGKEVPDFTFEGYRNKEALEEWLQNVAKKVGISLFPDFPGPDKHLGPKPVTPV